jgi:hypothetical protein
MIFMIFGIIGQTGLVLSVIKHISVKWALKFNKELCIPFLYLFSTFITFRSISKSCLMAASLVKQNILSSGVIIENLVSYA